MIAHGAPARTHARGQTVEQSPGCRVGSYVECISILVAVTPPTDSLPIAYAAIGVRSVHHADGAVDGGA